MLTIMNPFSSFSAKTGKKFIHGNVSAKVCRKQQNIRSPRKIFVNSAVNSDAFEKMSPEAQQQVYNIKKSLLNMNEARGKALEQLAQATQRIKQLEEQVANAEATMQQQNELIAQMEAHIATAQRDSYTAPSPTRSHQQPIAPQQHHHHQQQPQHHMYQQPPPQQRQAPPTPQYQQTQSSQSQAHLQNGARPAVAQVPQQQRQEAREPPAPTKQLAGISIVYQTGWSAPHIHYKSNNSEWTKAPGVPLEASPTGVEKEWFIYVDADEMEFVPNDGGSNWDKHDPYGAADNYVIKASGRYFLRKGKLERVAES